MFCRGRGARRQAHQQHLEARSKALLQRFVETQIERHQQPRQVVPRAWCAQVVRLAQLAVGWVDPAVHMGDRLDIRTYIKIKAIPGGERDTDCEVCDGTTVIYKYV